MDGKESSSVEAVAEKHGIKVHILQNLLDEGESAVQADVEPKPEDTYLICYTSGTTGNLKGLCYPTPHGGPTSPLLCLCSTNFSQRFNDAMKHQVNRKCGAVGKFLFHLAYKQKLSLGFKKAQDQLGGKVNLIITGSAQSTHVLESCRVSFGAHVIEGYGQTESTALATSTWPGEHIGGHCGGPAVCSLIKLVDVLT
uniref:long-chain-fatty-acid--CoA ligase n=1 Tax=Ditylenchus dipsaci TaxID=166011 RepID=A0A915CUT6_9BILA